MSMSVGTNNPGVRRIELKSADGTVTGSITITKTSRKKQKRLRYNFKEISARVMRARTSGNARRAAANARQKAAQLRKMQKSGIYDDKELQSAILHAEAIARAAGKRTRHLEEEERAEHTGNLCISRHEENIEELIGEETYETACPVDLETLQKLMQEAAEELERSNGISELSEELLLKGGGQNITPEELERIKKKHRSSELREIAEADMKYLKALFERLAREKRNATVTGSAASDSGSVSLQLGGANVSVQTAVLVDAPAAEGGVVDTKV